MRERERVCAQVKMLFLNLGSTKIWNKKTIFFCWFVFFFVLGLFFFLWLFFCNNYVSIEVFFIIYTLSKLIVCTEISSKKLEAKNRKKCENNQNHRKRAKSAILRLTRSVCWLSIKHREDVWKRANTWLPPINDWKHLWFFYKRKNKNFFYR